MSVNIINSIYFENFYNYYGSYENNTYNFKEGLNIVVADNGAGKSKFFNGILWLLKDIVYDSELNKDDKVEDVTFKIISDKAKDETSLGDSVRVGVKLSYQDSKFEYIVEKYFYSKRIEEGNPLHEKCWKSEAIEQEVSKRDLDLKTFHQVYSLEDQQRILDNIILKGLQPYALLQGEEIDNMIDFSTKDSLDKAINKLTNINRVKELVELSDYLLRRSDKDFDSMRKHHTKNANEFDEKLEKKEELVSDLAKNEKLLQATIDTLNSSKEERSNLLNSITNSKKRSEFRNKISEFEKEKLILSKEYENLLNNINSYFFNPEYSWLLMNLDGEMKTFSNIRDEFLEKRMKRKLRNELPTDIFTTVLPDGSPDFVSLEKMIGQEICFVCGREAKKGSDEWLYMKKVKDRPKPDLLKEQLSKNDFKDFFGDIQINAQEYYRKIIGINESVKQLKSKAAKYENEIREVLKKKEQAGEELFQFGGSSTSNNEKDKDKNILESYANANQRIGQCNIEIVKYKKEIDNLKISIDNVDKRISELGGSDLPKEYKETTELLTDISKIIGNTKDRIFSEILTRLETNSNKHFQNLTAGNNVDGGILKLSKTSGETVILEVVDKSGNPITGLSEGFQRMKKLAVVMAIISSRYNKQTFDYPLIADAPLSAFGKGFIEGFFNEVPNVFNQSIILVKELYDKERESHLTETGERILKKSEIGSFYLNEIEENKSQIERETKIICYK
jgi:DNA sulfur modification protein DndD